MNDDVKTQEQLSALTDGQLQGDEFAQAMRWAETDEGLQTWQVYHLIGDVMRSSELARPADLGFLSTLRAELAKAPPVAELAQAQVVQVAPVDTRVEVSANASVFHWKVAAGLASLAAVAALGWHTYAGMPGVSGPQLAIVAPVAGPDAATAVAENGPPGQSVMIRDPRLDELLAAHRQFGATSNLQMPAGFLRNATFEAPAR
ncbi:sigma-E factor negative regulatory protein [Paracidovorax wautersii]|uniref:Sigma-E factor negative regulatory protein RseA n=1 Tax=Paracidovorax wautersii TaxID=1177982 RepID=A0ABU1IDL8_9BURK|nr:sigma-E factor negative regulatory protein [Paracidovorax wautersii]MDR6214673.1 sigma-E factor negative regulatory protein RseA [Paracidovorax wautersii]